MDQIPAPPNDDTPHESESPAPPEPSPSSAPPPAFGPPPDLEPPPRPAYRTQGYSPGGPPAQAPGRSPVAWILIIVGVGVLGFSVFLNFALLMVVLSQSMTPMDGMLLEKKVSGTDRDKIAVVSVRGIISRGEAVLLFPTADMVETVRQQLRMAKADPRVKAVILEVDSPGGTITASDLILKDIKDFKKESNKPVVVCMQSMAASGGYYISMGADSIVAHPTTLTGSIGVIMQLMNYGELAKKHGVKWETFKPANAHLKDIGSPSRDMTPEDRAVFQSMVEKMYDLFIDRIVEGRKDKLTREQIMKLATGQPYLGTEAKESGLVDLLGTLETAVDEAKRLANIVGDPMVVRYQKPPSFASMLGVEMPGSGPSGELGAAVKALETKMSPKLLYLYCP